jgi:hypothetical protein
MRIARTLAVLGLALGPMAVSMVPAAATRAPARWDPRVVDYVRFVERHRKLHFDHPVPVAFLDDKKFVRELHGDREPTEKERADAARTAGELRALGLIEGEVDLIEAERDLDATGVVGFYDAGRERLFVRGRDLTSTDTRVTLVHELTHALQDQHFDLDHLRRATKTGGEDFALTALEEGDAVSVENAYVASLPRKEHDAYVGAVGSQPSAPDGPGKSATVPPVLELIEAAPYVFGPEYVDVLKRLRGTGGVDAAFTRPPVSEDEVVDPVAASRSAEPVAVPVPKLAPGEHRDGPPDDFGALSLYLTLAARVEPQTALRAAQGWGGDRSIAYTKDGITGQCLRIALRGDTAADTRQIADALEAWAATLPEGAAGVDRRDGTASLSACEVDGITAPTRETLDHALEVLVDRNELVLGFLKDHAPVVSARCVADRIVDDTQLLPLFATSTLTEEQKTLARSRVAAYVSECGSGRRGGA